MEAVIAAVALALIVVLGATIVALRGAIVEVPLGKALIINKIDGTSVRLSGRAVVMPIVHSAELMDITLHTIELTRKGSEGLICRDNIRVDVETEFYLRVGRTEGDVLQVAQSIGTARASDRSTLEELFTAKFAEAMKTVANQLQFNELTSRTLEFKDDVLSVIGSDLNGFVLDDLVIRSIAQTPLDQLDPNNILDAEGIKAIVERTASATNVQQLLTVLASHSDGRRRKDIQQLLQRAIELGVA